MPSYVLICFNSGSTKRTIGIVYCSLNNYVKLAKYNSLISKSVWFSTICQIKVLKINGAALCFITESSSSSLNSMQAVVILTILVPSLDALFSR